MSNDNKNPSGALDSAAGRHYSPLEEMVDARSEFERSRKDYDEAKHITPPLLSTAEQKPPGHRDSTANEIAEHDDVPARQESEPAVSTEATANNHVVEKESNLDTDKLIVDTRIDPSYRSFWPEIMLFISLFVGLILFKDVIYTVAVSIFTMFGATEEEALAKTSHYIVWVLVGSGAMIYARMMFLRYYTHLQVTKDHVEMHRGIIARNRSKVSLEHIRNIEVSQNVMDRLLNIGTIEVGTAGTADNEIIMERVFDPLSVRQRIKETQVKYSVD